MPRTFSGARSAGLAAGLLVAWSAVAKPVTPDLTPRLRSLLQEEMQAVLGASQSILEAIVIGDHSTVAVKAEQIHSSFILKQSLTKADKRDLKRAVPKRFIRLDRSFHAQSERLAEAARAQDSERELAVFQRMLDACVGCHADYVGDRFPGLGRQRGEAHQE